MFVFKLSSITFVTSLNKKINTMKIQNHIQKLYPNCQILGVSQIFFQNSGWTIYEKDILFFSYNNVTTLHFDKVIKAMLKNDEMKIEKLTFKIISENGEERFFNWSNDYALNIL